MLFGLILLSMALSSLLIIRGLSQIPDIVTVQLVDEEINIDLHGVIHLLATPSQFAAQLWGDESMAISVAFLLLGLGLSLIFKKKITSRIRKN
jgi:hypothetical protein